MTAPKRRFGDLGEAAAAEHLKKNGYRILDRNYTVGRREIDIIAESRTHLVFIEVKTRTYSPANLERYGRACLAVDADKRRNLIAAAEGYIAKHRTRRKRLLRFDVIEVYFEDTDPPALHSIHHMTDAFRAV